MQRAIAVLLAAALFLGCRKPVQPVNLSGAEAIAIAKDYFRANGPKNANEYQVGGLRMYQGTNWWIYFADAPARDGFIVTVTITNRAVTMFHNPWL